MARPAKVWYVSPFPLEASLGVLSVTGEDVHGAPIASDLFSKSAAGFAQYHLHCLTGHPTRPSVYRLSDSWLGEGDTL